MNDENKGRNNEEPAFYYSRDRRLASAPEKVKMLYSGSFGRRSGLFGSLLATKSLAFLFLAILMLSATAMVMSFLLHRETNQTALGNAFSVEAFRFQGSTYVAITKESRTNDAYTGPLDVAVSPYTKSTNPASIQVYTQSFLIGLKTREEFRFSVPFEAEKIIVLLQCKESLNRFVLSVK